MDVKGARALRQRLEGNAMMACGHAANARGADGGPCCAICHGINPGAHTVAEQPPELAGRAARCSCGKTAASSASLPFFEFRGEGSRSAVDSCRNCGYSLVAHTQEATRTQRNVVEEGRCPGFVESGAWRYDGYYCGCRGWD